MCIKQLLMGSATVGALVLVGGCSSAGSSAASSDPKLPTQSATPTAAPSPAVRPATAARLRKIVLQATDMPGWKASPPDDSSDAPDSEQTELVACVGAQNTDADQIADIESANFGLGDAQISSSASSYAFQSDLDNDLTVLESPKFVPCISRQLKRDLAGAIPAGGRMGTLSVKFAPGSGTGPANVAGTLSATVPITANGRQDLLYIDYVYLTGSFIEAEVDGESLGAPVPAAAMRAAVRAVAARVVAGS
jgi:hypothetical protein